MSYAYDLAGHLTAQTYPSGRVVQTDYDAAGRIAGVKQPTGSYYAGGSPTDATGRIQYAAHGAVSAMRLGNTLCETTRFNSKLQPTQIGLGTQSSDAILLRLDYGYGSSDNNGNVRSQAIAMPGLSLSQTFTYDPLNRLETARESKSDHTESWKQQFTYDRFGNRTIDTNPAYTTSEMAGPNPAISSLTNRITPRAGEYYHYDTAGNLDRDQTNNAYAYDAENRQVSYNGGAGVNGGTSYSYDGEGRRVKKVTPIGVTIFVYNVLGQVVAEYSSEQGTSSGTSYLTPDMMGSVRVVTDSSGQVRARHDYFPFGEELFAGVGGRTQNQGYSQSDNVRQKFTGKERDAETGLDYFLNRYYSSTQGRFTGVDIAGPDLTNPQTLNKYQYCLNNPLRYIDRQGLYEEDVHRDLTYVLALAAGFNSVSAREISNADQGVDDNPETSPMGMTPWGKDVETRELYHFTSEERRGEMWQAFEQSGSHERLGEFFHAQQDSFSHAGYGARWGHASAGHAPDKTYNDPDKADRMASDTFSRMQNALTIGIKRGSETTTYTGLSWNKIAPMVQAFNRAKTPEEKQKIIGQIEVVARRHQLKQDEQRKREEEERRRKEERQRAGGRSQ